MDWKFSAYTCQCLKSFSIFSWKSLTRINGIFPTHKVRQVSPLFITSGAQIQNKAWFCLRESTSSCPSQRKGNLSARKNQLVPPDCTLTTLDMEQDTWRELPGILASLFFEAFLGTVPGTCHFSPWSLREIHQFPDQSGFPLPRGGRRRKKDLLLPYCLIYHLIYCWLALYRRVPKEFTSPGCKWGAEAPTIPDQNPHTLSFPQWPTRSIKFYKIMTFAIILQPFLLKQGVIFNMKWPHRARGRWLSSGWV